MKFGHRLTGKISRYDDSGRGVFEVEQSKIAVPFTAIGDEIDATFIHRDRGYKLARLDTVKIPGPDRIATPCPHAGICGGCLWQHLSYDAQITLKRDMVNAALERAGHDERISELTPAVAQFHHRNRMDYVVGWNGQLGLKEYGSWNRYVDLKTCLLLDEGVGEILDLVRAWMHEFDLQPWDVKFYTGDVRYVVIREGKNTKQRLMCVVVKDAARVTPEAKSALTSRVQSLAITPTTLLLGEQSLVTDLSLSQTFETLYGEPWIEEIVNDVRYRIHPNSFFQTNSQMAGELQRLVKEFLPKQEKLRVLDLYCGLGFFGIYLAKELPDAKVHGVEIDAEAIKLATHNAKANGVSDRTEFVSAKAEDMSWKDIPADVVILDPPRAGLHPRVLKTVLEKKPETIIYVSCNYKRLVEELKDFKSAYRVETVRAVDLFPHTPHIEVIAKLVRNTTTNTTKDATLSA